MTRSFEVFFDLRPNKRLSKQSWGWWSETPSSSLWRHRNDPWLVLGQPCDCPIDLSHKFHAVQEYISHNAPFCNRNAHFCQKWCTVEYLFYSLWDLWHGFITSGNILKDTLIKEELSDSLAKFDTKTKEITTRLGIFHHIEAWRKCSQFFKWHFQLNFLKIITSEPMTNVTQYYAPKWKTGLDTFSFVSI